MIIMKSAYIPTKYGRDVVKLFGREKSKEKYRELCRNGNFILAQNLLCAIFDVPLGGWDYSNLYGHYYAFAWGVAKKEVK